MGACHRSRGCLDRGGVRSWRDEVRRALHEHWEPRLRATGAACLDALSGQLAGADPLGTVRPQSRVLCAALGEVSGACYADLGGSRVAAEVRRVGAMLALLTKIDDQVIDGLAFHGGMVEAREAVRRRVRAYLAPTLASVRSGRAETDEPRCRLAAELGRCIVRLAAERRRAERLLDVIAQGWEIQVDAVAVFTGHPAWVTTGEVAAVSARISGAWLLMIALVGSLPDDVSRALTEQEESGFYAWGAAIQRADALSDFVKDVDDGLICTALGHATYVRAPQAYLAACAEGDAAELLRLVHAVDADLGCVDGEDQLRALDEALAGLAAVPSLFEWIRRHLLGRYLDHPHCLRRAGVGAFAGYAAVGELSRGVCEGQGEGPGRVGGREPGGLCSVR